MTKNSGATNSHSMPSPANDAATASAPEPSQPAAVTTMNWWARPAASSVLRRTRRRLISDRATRDVKKAMKTAAVQG
jgi:hypothetical protein